MEIDWEADIILCVLNELLPILSPSFLNTSRAFKKSNFKWFLNKYYYSSLGVHMYIVNDLNKYIEYVLSQFLKIKLITWNSTYLIY